jgi:hypothetical protein
MCDIPVHVADEEQVVRAIFSNHLKNKSTLEKNVFYERNDDLSVMRHTHLGSDQCKKHALEVKPRNPQITYKGFAVIGVKVVREVGSQVTDSRDGNYCGHASLSHGIALPPADDPLFAEQKLALDDRLRKLKTLARFVPDKDPSAEAWTGEAF